jgi:UDPglucose--hexose-1-phosphate uridylyltransferase
MSSKIRFQVIEDQSTFLHPQKDFQPATERFEVRVDPLTGRTGHYSHFGAIKPQKLPLEAYARDELKGFCPFCLEHRDRITPKFLEGILPEGRLVRNQAVVVPNLFPYDVHSGIAIMTDEHVVPFPAMDRQILTDAFSAGIAFLKRIRSVDTSLPYHVMTWNYMPPAGGGLVHPHQQYFATRTAGNQFRDELRASEEFYRQHGASYWRELVEEEEARGLRYLGTVGTSRWLTSFVSFGVLGDVISIFPEVFSLDDFTEHHLDDLVSGLLKVFRYYVFRGIYSLNACLFFGPLGQQYFSTHFRVVPRTFLNMRDYAPDFNFFQALLSEPVSVVMPEVLCAEMKEFF